MVTTKTPTQTFLLSRKHTQWLSCFDAVRPQVLSSYGQICEYVSHAGKNTLWISEEEQLTNVLLQCAPKPGYHLGDALLFYMPSIMSMPVLNGHFRHTVFGPSENFLPLEELVEVLADDQKADLMIGSIVDHASQSLILWRGSFEPLYVPFEAFTPSGNGVSPDFGRFKIIDYGQTIQLGPYEAATEALLYELDPDYRRRIGKERRESEQSFGAALRRLRKQRGLRREDFAPLSAKTIARIEQGKVHLEQIHNRTWEILSEKLGVKPEEIETF
jgi:hypothetical protein